MTQDTTLCGNGQLENTREAGKSLRVFRDEGSACVRLNTARELAIATPLREKRTRRTHGAVLFRALHGPRCRPICFDRPKSKGSTLAGSI